MVGRFPDVSLIMVHGGRNWLREDAIEVTKRNSNIYVESSVMYSQYVTRVVEEFSPERVLMSTDSPTEVFETEARKITMAVQDPEVRVLVMGDNLVRLFKLNQ